MGKWPKKNARVLQVKWGEREKWKRTVRMSLTLLFPLYPSTPHPKLPLVSHLLTIPAPKIVDINWSLPKDGCETPTSGWWWWLEVWPSQTSQKPFMNIATIEKDNHWYVNHHSFASALLISTPFDLDRKKNNFELQEVASDVSDFSRFRIP